MAKFCKKCGSPLNPQSGVCPRCGFNNAPVQRPAQPQNPAQPQRPMQPQQPTQPQRPVQPQQPAQPQKPMPPQQPAQPPQKEKPPKKTWEQKQREKIRETALSNPEKAAKLEKKLEKKLAKKAKNAKLSKKQRVRRICLKIVAILLALSIVLGSTSFALVYFDIADIPFISAIMDKLGVHPYFKPDASGFSSLDGKFSNIKVVDDNSAIAAAQEGAAKLGLGNAADELTVKNTATVDGFTYYRLQQNYKGVPVYRRTFSVASTESGTTQSFTSNAVHISNINTKSYSSVSEDTIKNLVTASLSSEVTVEYYSVHIPSSDDLVIYICDDGKAKLAYSLTCETNIGSYNVVIDANGEELLFIESAILYEQQEFTYPGQNKTQTFYAENAGAHNEMVYESVSGTKITVRTPNHKYSWTSTLNSSDIVTWTDSEPNHSAVDALTYTIASYNFFLDTFNLDSLDGKKTDLNVFVNVDGYHDNEGDADYNITNNAFHYRTPYGQILAFTKAYKDGEETNEKSADIDVVAHEYTHGVENNISGMEYQGESGAIMEAYSDIFGEFVESYATNRPCDWIHGKRNMIDPSSKNNERKLPSTYQGKYWVDTDNTSDSNDYGGVHYNNTVISHAAYLMNNGVNGTLTSIGTYDLATLWYHTLYLLPSNCTYTVLRECLEMTAFNLGFSSDEQLCVSTALQHVGIEDQAFGAETLSKEATLQVLDRSGAAYDDYKIEIKGKKTTYLVFSEDYEKTIPVRNSRPVELDLPRGDYTLTIIDNFRDTITYTKKIKIRNTGKKDELVLMTNLGFDYNINTSSGLTVYDMNNEAYDNYTLRVSGKYTSGENQTEYENEWKVTNSDPFSLSLNEGKYSFLLIDGADSAKIKSFTVRVRSTLGASELKVGTAFGKKAGAFDRASIPAGAKEYNGHYYLICTDECGWDSAKNNCKNSGGYLATITSAGEQQFIEQYISEFAAQNTVTNPDGTTVNWEKSLWIGANDTAFEGDWKWANGEKFDYSHWGTNQPDNMNEQDYASILSFHSVAEHHDLQMGTWDDERMPSAPYICEWGEYTPENAERRLSIKTMRQTSDERDIVLVLDVSGSMSGAPLQHTKNSAVEFIDTILAENASIGIVTYDSNAKLRSDFSMDADYLKEIVNNLGTGGGTNIDSGLAMAYDLLQYSNADKKSIVLMSDGEPNEGRTGDELVSFSDTIKNDGIYVYTLGFFESLGSNKANAQKLMDDIASDGCHYEVKDANDLVFFFGDIAAQISGERFVYVRLACPVDVTVSYNGEELTSETDNFNGRTSFGSLTLESIEDSDETIKTLRLKDGVDYDIVIEGTGRGKMDYTIGFMDENGDYSDMREFKNIKIQKSTVIDTNTSAKGKTYLNIDEDGDGKYDLKYSAGENEKGEIVDYTAVICISIGAVVAIGIAIAVIIIIKRKKKTANAPTIAQ